MLRAAICLTVTMMGMWLAALPPSRADAGVRLATAPSAAPVTMPPTECARDVILEGRKLAPGRASTSSDVDLVPVNIPYCYENPWDRATCLKDDAPTPVLKGMMQSPRRKKRAQI